MADLHIFLNELKNALREDGDGGCCVTGGEIDQIRSFCPDIVPDFVDDVALMTGSHGDGYLFDAQEISKLEQKYPALTHDFFLQAGHVRDWPGNFKLFLPDAGSIDIRACDDLKGKIESAVSRIRLSFGENENALEEKKAIFRSADFMSFACFMREAYDIDVIKNSYYGLSIYRDPTSLALWRDPRNVAIYSRINQMFPEKLKGPVRIEDLEIIRKRTNLEQDIEKARRLIGIFNGAYPVQWSFDSFSSLAFELSQIDNPSYERRVMAFIEPAIVKFNTFLQTNFGRRLPMTDSAMGLAREFGGDPDELLLLKEFLPRISLPLDRDVDAGDVRRITDALGETRVRKLLKQFKPREWRQVGLTVDLARHPRVNEILPLIDSDNVYGQFREIETALNIAADSVFWTNLALVMDDCPGSADYVFDRQDLSWLKEASTTGVLLTGKAKEVCEALYSEWGIDHRSFSVEFIGEMLSLSDTKLALLRDKEFHQKARDTFSLLMNGETMGSWNIKSYIEMGPEALEELGSPRSLKFIEGMRRTDPGFFVEIDRIDQYRDIISNETCLHAFTSLIESGIFGKENLMEEVPSIFTFYEMMKKDPDLPSDVEQALPFLKQLAADGSVRTNISCLPELVKLGKVTDAAPALAGISRILGRPIKDEYYVFGGRPVADELRLAGQLAKQAGAARILDDRKFELFCKKTAADILVPPSIRMRDLMVLLDMYKNDKEGIEEELASLRFKNMMLVLRRDFNITELRADTLKQLITVSRTYDEQKIKRLCERLGRRMVANDISILSRVAHDPELERLLFDRVALSSEAIAVYQKEPKVRRMQGSTEREPEIPSERTPIEELDDLALLRLVLLSRALNDPETIKGLGKIVAGDLADKKTEHGGLLLFEGDRPRFSDVSSLSESDGTYVSPLSRFLQDGMMSFHLHALEEDFSAYSGPSGLGHLGLHGDWVAAKNTGETGVVVTTCGRVEGSPDEIWINVDMYYYDEEGNDRMVDMGMYKVKI